MLAPKLFSDLVCVLLDVVFEGRLMQAFPRECTESFQESHRRAFEFFGGVPRRISYDANKIAVAKILGSRDRKITSEFLRLESHYLFKHHFCLVRLPNEKGHVERLLDFAHNNYLVPVPKVDSLAQLNEQLRKRQENFLVRLTPGTHRVFDDRVAAVELMLLDQMIEVRGAW
ncbi:MAG: hypothetical protein MI757_02835 [Pirellulales bacterium]|nr:hypothetical protein [Pirellulales bacterium]